MKHLLFPLSFLACIIISKAQSPQLWGTCEFGGDFGQGAIIKSDSSGWNFHVVYSFDSINGAAPVGLLCSGGNGKLYGVTVYGGYNDSCVVFSYDTSTGIYHKLHDLAFHPDSGDGVQSGMLLAADGKLYGTTAWGGINDYGVIYRVDPSIDSYSPLFHFSYATGAHPYCKLVQLADGNLYGTTYDGGQNYWGVIFRFNPSDSSYTDLYDLTNATGTSPQYGALLPGADGKLYGLTKYGGANNHGVVFSYDPLTDTYTDLHDFNLSNGDGGDPFGGLTKANNGLLYGMTNIGGINTRGVIFKYDLTTQQYAVVFNFSDSTGWSPTRSLLQGSNGKLFGTADKSQSGDGTAFSFDPANDAFVKLIDFSSIGCSFPWCEFIETGVDVATAIATIGTSNHEQLSTYPNPAKDNLTIPGNIRTPETEIEIYNDQSKRVYDFTVTGNAINVSRLSPGFYILKIRSGSRVEMGKFVKE